LFESSFGSTTLALTASPEELGTRRSKLSTRILDYFTRSASEETAETLEKSLGFRDSVLVENQRNSAVNLEVSIKQFIRSYSEVDNGIL
jgi:hypothetical protein